MTRLFRDVRTAAALLALPLILSPPAEAKPAGKYAEVNGLRMYYEVHGQTGNSPPLVMIHGAFGMIDNNFGTMIPTLAKKRQVIAVELQGHGRTADIDRPLRYEQLADDVAALLKQLNQEKADVYGYSMGGGTALQIAIRHPDLVRKLVVVSATYDGKGWQPGLLDMIKQMKPEQLAESPWARDYGKFAPQPGNWTRLVEKVKDLDSQPQSWPVAAIQGIQAPTLVICGDSDGVQAEHAVEMYRLRGGGAMGDLAGLPDSQLAILPGTHHVGVLERAEWLLSMVPAFLDAPVKGKAGAGAR